MDQGALESRKQRRPRRSRKSSYLNRGGQAAGSPPPLSEELTQSLQSPDSLSTPPAPIRREVIFSMGSEASQGLSLHREPPLQNPLSLTPGPPRRPRPSSWSERSRNRGV